jgi:uncharacterized membrane-anchored protein YhcB (DUF1043 family)
MSPEIISTSIIAFVGIVVTIAGFLAVRTLQLIDKNQQALSEEMTRNFKDLYDKYNHLNANFHELHGEHCINHERRKHPRMEWPK